MGGRQSKKFDPAGAAEAAKKEGTEERLEKIEEQEAGPKVQNGSPPQPDVPKECEETKAVQDAEGTPTSVVNGDSEAITADLGAGDASLPAPESETAAGPPVKDVEKSPESSETKSPDSEEKSEKKKKDKSKKKWSFRSISFSKKDKNKPIPKEDSKSDLSKEQPVPEVSETETATASPTSPTEEPELTPVVSDDQKVIQEKEKPTKVEAKVVSTPEPIAIVTEEVKEEKEEMKSEEKRAEEVRTETSEKVETLTESSSMEVTEVISQSTTITSVTVTEKVEAMTERKSDEIPPPLPASPPPTEAPPPTPVAQTQPEPEEVNGGGEGMAEMPEENGLDTKIDDDEEEPKMNGHCEQSPVKQIVESIIEKVEVMKIVDNSEMTELSENLETSSEVASAEE